jgi:DNA-directed RNA polymerase alpha subunit
MPMLPKMNNEVSNHAQFIKEEFYKTRVERLGLTDRWVNTLLQKNIRTAGGIAGRSKTELKKILKVSTEEINTLLDEVSQSVRKIILLIAKKLSLRLKMKRTLLKRCRDFLDMKRYRLLLIVDDKRWLESAI